jgi:hypothetical protein
LNARRTAAAMIFGELTGNFASAASAVSSRVWTSAKPEAQRAAWEAYGGRLLLLRPWHRPHDVGHVAAAYNRVDDVAWLATEEILKPGDDYSDFLMDIAAGVYVVGRLAGYTNDELRDRQVPSTRFERRFA